MVADQKSLKGWQEDLQDPKYSIGDRVKYKGSTWRGEEEVRGTVIGVNPRCVGEEWIYVIVGDSNTTARIEEIREGRLKKLDEDREKLDVMKKFGERVYELVY